MESGMMKVVFSSIINGSHRKLANETKCDNRETAAKTENVYKAGLLSNDTDQAADNFDYNNYQEKTSQEVFAALVNASNCANLRMVREPDRYLTFAPGGAFLRKYR